MQSLWTASAQKERGITIYPKHGKTLVDTEEEEETQKRKRRKSSVMKRTNKAVKD